MIEVEVRNTPSGVMGYPKIMKVKGMNKYVLFLVSNCGTVIKADDDVDKMGEYLTNWDMNLFEDFNGEIILKNV